MPQLTASLTLTGALLLCACAPTLRAPNPVSRDAPPESTHGHTLASSFVDQDYRIHVAVPLDYEESDRSYPVLYLLDADVLFGLVTDLCRLLPVESAVLGTQRVPELIVVGIGYPGGYGEMSVKRGRDFNPKT